MQDGPAPKTCGETGWRLMSIGSWEFGLKLPADMRLMPKDGTDGECIEFIRRRHHRSRRSMLLLVLILSLSTILVIAFLAGYPEAFAALTEGSRASPGPVEPEAGDSAMRGWMVGFGLVLAYAVIYAILRFGPRMFRLSRLLLRYHDKLAEQGKLPADCHSRPIGRAGKCDRSVRATLVAMGRAFCSMDVPETRVIERARRCVRLQKWAYGVWGVVLAVYCFGIILWLVQWGRSAPGFTPQRLIFALLGGAAGVMVAIVLLTAMWAWFSLVLPWSSYRADELVLRYHDLLAAEGALPEDLKSADNAVTVDSKA